jgi:succinate dehydrogenase flavin-adding protein (antitoxin of CptAB toxin-antitoxin module)
VSIDNKIEYRCKRGHLELDLVLNKLYKESITKMSTQDKVKLLSFLEIDDHELLKLLTSPESNSSKDMNSLLKLIKNYTYYKSKKGHINR